MSILFGTKTAGEFTSAGKDPVLYKAAKGIYFRGWLSLYGINIAVFCKVTMMLKKTPAV